MSGGRVTSRLPAFVRSVEQRAVVGMTQAMVLGASEASVLTPIDTSTLLNSQYRDVQVEADQVRGRVGYLADYAPYVHDPDNEQNFRRATAEKEFLTKGFERSEPAISDVLHRALRV